MSVTFCPICGAGVPNGISIVAVPGLPPDQQHRCRDGFLRQRDNVMTQDRQPGRPRYDQRLADGFRLLEGEDS